MAVTIDGTSGVTTPGVVNTAGQTIATTLAVTGVTTIAAGSAAAPALVGATGGATTGVWFPAASTVAFANAGVESARIDSSGNFTVNTGLMGIGMASVGTVRLSVAASSAFIMIGRDSTGTTDQFRISPNGNVGNTTGTYGALSDRKLKENIVDATPKLQDICKVRIVNYNLKASLGYEDHKQIGVIAQEIEQIFPGLVDESPDTDKEGVDLGTTTKSVKMSLLVPMLVKAIQEQQTLITALTARITALEAANV